MKMKDETEKQEQVRALEVFKPMLKEWTMF